MDVAVGRSESCLGEKTRRVFRAHQQGGWSSIHLRDQIGRGRWAGVRVENLQIEIPGLSRVDGCSELRSAVERCRHRGTVLQHLSAIDKVAARKDDGGWPNI